MKNEFYIGQPLVVKRTGEKVTFVYDDGDNELPCIVVRKDGCFYRDCYDYEQVEPSTEFKISEIIAGIEQGYFKIGTKFRRLATDRIIIVERGIDDLCLNRSNALLSLTSRDIHSTWELVEDSKEMTLEEIEAELGYKIKLKDHGES